MEPNHNRFNNNKSLVIVRRVSPDKDSDACLLQLLAALLISDVDNKLINQSLMFVC
jgi:nanoRNase/pAp phosphatase (c-di-AMP/oligoRNAs hydrolase)